MEKAPDAFRTISEVAEEIDVPQHVLRFWESRFAQIRPLKRGGGRRYYRPDDVDLLRGVRHLLYGEGYTIRGVQRILREEGLSFVQSVWRPGAEPLPPDVAETDAPNADEQAALDAGEEPAFFAVPQQHAQPSDGATPARREPTIVPRAIAEPTIVPPQRHDITGEDRRKLQTVLDELTACRALIDAALSDNAIAED